jgi:hypothetical protein
MNEELAAKIRGSLIDGQLRCATAFGIASELGVPPMEVGLTADEMDVRLSHCQLGLFGYGSKAEGTHRIVKPAEHVSAKMEAAIRGGIEGRGITCRRLWEIAAEQGCPKMDVSGACDTLGIKISICQLGAFPRPKKN